jgi:hypothetical protein
MKNTYATPTVTARGGVVETTQIMKGLLIEEAGNIRRPPFGANLSFGL